jgi:phosphopantothenoylcysteine decarboxylase/phosphopantothenate--cysteine ligase
VELVHGPVTLAIPQGVRAYPVVTGADMLVRTSELFPNCDILIMTAAVCDFRPKYYSADKAKKEDVTLWIEFERTPDILKTLSARKTAGQTLVGFAAETQDIENYARRKLVEKNLDFIAANRVGGGNGSGVENGQPRGNADTENAFESDVNRIVLLEKGGERSEYGPAPKWEVARWLVGEILKKRVM